ncbi:hypothetical protein [Nocardia arthritidis]|uniref:Uncharacterized protein n=1 Tax=Nocardia arthritidis TaxID=228602 RepID=A0A6G9YBM6_9NOCA|nr:hypothetical protein [Nocardia arthritidis]QIS10631.1 hypothetical protein F5544_13715 [Nocardia arthritidis]
MNTPEFTGRGADQARNRLLPNDVGIDLIPDSDESSVVFAAVRELYGVRVADWFVVYDSHCVDAVRSADMCLVITPVDDKNVQALEKALVTGTPYGCEVLRAQVECGGASLTNITTTGSPDELATLRTALAHFNTSSTDPRKHAVFRALYLHLCGAETSVQATHSVPLGSRSRSDERR